MKKLPLALAIVAVLLSAVALIKTTSKTEQVYVDVNKLLEGYDRTAIVRGELQEKTASLTSGVDSLLGQWQSEIKLFEKERSSMTKKELALKKELLANKQNQINGYQQGIKKQLQEEDQVATQTVINDINDFVEEFGKENGHNIILGATGSGTIMYAADDSDLTDEVLEALNKSFKGE